ncbi:hypothetical protein NCCP2331_35470 [Sporosarcina sp. NCCP-2331]|nr:hypothetical protein NCCP2331_35470 [Sporosarcina sp. NCCP-2331]GLB57750.1 hypothetical protein NCCP2378_35400 [Sporosarcina sp. NCCP-2378]
MSGVNDHAAAFSLGQIGSLGARFGAREGWFGSFGSGLRAASTAFGAVKVRFGSAAGCFRA